MDAIATKVQERKIANIQPNILRLVICGSVDDGKSTLIGRLLYDAGLIYEDQQLALAKDSKKNGFSTNYDYSLLLDGLSSEREQKITIDIAWRYFATAKRRFIIADAPGHIEYTANMVTAASTANVALVLIDVQKGIVGQTRRHTMIAALMGIQQIIVIINKMDLVQYDQKFFIQLAEEYKSYGHSLGIANIRAIPASALKGDNVIESSPNMAWYKGKTLIASLENIEQSNDDRINSFRMPVQWVNRPNADFRGFSGQIVSGTLRPGNCIKVFPSGQRTNVERIVSFDGDLTEAKAGDSITLTFTEPVDVSRGDVITLADDPCQVADQLEVDLFWMSQQPMISGRQYSLRMANRYLLCTLNKPDYITDIDTLNHLYSPRLEYNQIGRCTLLLDRLTAFDCYNENHRLGCLLIINKVSQEILAAGVIRKGIQRSTHIPCQFSTINYSMRSNMKLQKPFVIWFTGLSGAGKTTVANLLEKKLYAQGLHTMLLDANNIRHGLNKDLGFSEACRIENTRRIAEVAKLMLEAGLITLVACIAPFAAERKVTRSLIGDAQYIEIFVDAPLSVVEARDVSGLYAKVRSGEIHQFTGISAVYEPPESPDLHINTAALTVEAALQNIFDWLVSRKYL